jgi:hypothetical protein
MPSLLVLRSYLRLIQFDFYLVRRNFQALYKKVRQQRVRALPSSSNVVDQVCSAVDVACIWYWKEVLCLQRSAATVTLLRKYGVPAQLVIGTQQLPFRAHAWVEVDGQVVNDKPYTPEMYVVLDRC